jgi:serine/threonine-protein kinase ULK/ATG1
MSRKQVGKYILDRRIGKGSYAQVWLGHCDESFDPVAVKVISRHTLNETAQLRQEVAVLKKIDHINIVKFRDLKKSVGHYYLVLEYCEGGDLARFIQRHGRMKEESARRFLQQLSAGLMILHRLSFIHRDLKPQNILLTCDSDDAILKIADFGFARVLDSTDMAATVCGSPLYMAPEILRHEKYDGRADIWSLGTIVYELICGCPPYTGSNPMQLLANIECAARAVAIPKTVAMSEACRSLLEAVLVKDPKDRISVDNFFAHDFNLGPAAALCATQSIDPQDVSLPEDDITLIEESSPANIHTGTASSTCSTEPLVLYTGIHRVVSEGVSLQTQGPLAETSYAGTQTALGMLLRYVALEVVAMNESSSSDGEMNAVDALGIIAKSCEFLDNALDQVVDNQGVVLLELELAQSFQAAALIQSKFSYRGFTASARPLRWVYAYVLKMLQESETESDVEKKKLALRGAELLIDFLVHEFQRIDTTVDEEETVKRETEQTLLFLRSQIEVL